MRQNTDTITATFQWKCACGTKVTGSQEDYVVAERKAHREKHRLQALAILAGDAELAVRIMKPEPAEGWVPGYNC